jgi:hypothetical protein
MCAFTTDFDRKVAGYSPDRVDALVWAFSDLFVQADGQLKFGAASAAPMPAGRHRRCACCGTATAADF